MGLDILMITYNRPLYTEKSLRRLLESAREDTRVWVWHNGMDRETLQVVESFKEHPRFYRLHHSQENKKLNEPTNWLWRESDGEYLGKVDDDCLVSDVWLDVLESAHAANSGLGVAGCWHFLPEDLSNEDVVGKVVQLEEHRLLRNCWIGGSGYLMKRRAQEQLGFLREGQSWPQYVLELSARGWVNGWYYPFIYQEHMDDPRSPNTLFRSDEDVYRMAGLTARQRGITTVQALLERQQVAVNEIINSSLDPRQYVSWRRHLNQIKVRLGLPDGRRCRR